MRINASQHCGGESTQPKIQSFCLTLRSIDETIIILNFDIRNRNEYGGTQGGLATRQWPLSILFIRPKDPSHCEKQGGRRFCLNYRLLGAGNDVVIRIDDEKLFLSCSKQDKIYCQL